MKKTIFTLVFFILVLGQVLRADSIIIDVGAKSNHLIDGTFNEKHNWKGVAYRFIEKDKYNVEIKGVNLSNSYGNNTNFVAFSGICTPIIYKDIKIGLSASLGYQEGYYVNLNGTVHPEVAKKMGLSNKSILVLYSLYFELDNIIVHYTYIPDSVEAITVGFKAVEW